MVLWKKNKTKLNIIKYKYIFFREALRTATCNAIKKESLHRRENYKFNYKSKELNLNEKVKKKISADVRVFYDDNFYYLVKNREVVFVEKLKGRDVEKKNKKRFQSF